MSVMFVLLVSSGFTIGKRPWDTNVSLVLTYRFYYVHIITYLENVPNVSYILGSSRGNPSSL